MKMKIGFALAVVLCVVAATLPCLEAKQATRAARKLKFSESSDSEISDSGTEGQLLVKDLVEPNARALKWGSTYYYRRPSYGYRHSYSSYRKHGHKYLPYYYKDWGGYPPYGRRLASYGRRRYKYKYRPYYYKDWGGYPPYGRRLASYGHGYYKYK